MMLPRSVMLASFQLGRTSTKETWRAPVKTIKNPEMMTMELGPSGSWVGEGLVGLYRHCGLELDNGRKQNIWTMHVSLGSW